jgi:DnaJ-class molecular chaperone
LDQTHPIKSTTKMLSGKRREELCGILNIETTATESEIKSAYYKLAKEHHPDQNPENKEESTKKFQEIANAYEILSKVTIFLLNP